MFVLRRCTDKACDSKLLFLISCHMQAKYNLPIVFSLREVKLGNVLNFIQNYQSKILLHIGL